MRGTGIFAVAALLLSAAPAPALERCRAVDGDTLNCNGERVRLMALDTPEAKWRARCPREERLALRATNRLGELVANGVTLEPHGREKYGRLLARVYAADGRDVAVVLIGEGLGVEYHGRGQRKDWCKPEAKR